MLDVLVFPCTYKCDAKCMMCSIYEKRSSDLSLQELVPFFENSYVNSIRSINITGGEPTLRNDLLELVQMISYHCKNLGEIIINTNGLNSYNVLNKCEEICGILPPKIKLWVFVSLDAINDKADKIRGVENAAAKAMKTVDLLISLKEKYENLKIGISTTIVSENAYLLESVFKYVVSKNIFWDVIYATVNTTFIDSESKSNQFLLNEEQKKNVIEFLPKLLQYDKRTLSKENIYKMIERINGKAGNKNCILRDGKGLLLEADGKIRACGMTNEILLGDIHDEEFNFSKWLNKLEQYDNYCDKCNTDSYYNWSVEAQNVIIKEMMEKVVKKKRNAKV